MATVKFQISTRNSGRLRTIQVYVYATKKHMERAGCHNHEYCGKGCVLDPPETRADGKIFELHALTQTFLKKTVSKGGLVRRQRPAGYMRFYRAHISVEVISHEATHMAVWIYKTDVQKTIPDMEREEKLCYLVGDIAQKINDGLYRHKVLVK